MDTNLSDSSGFEAALALARRTGLQLDRTEAGLALSDGSMRLAVDFSELSLRARPDRLHRELLVKAAKLKGVDRVRVLDATAGLGEDSFLLAATGCRVDLVERDPVIAALLADGLARASCDEGLAGIVARMHLIEADSIDLLQEAAGRYDIVYLDPMFPARTKSAAVKKKFQLLHHLEQPCDDEAGMLQAALCAHPRKIVVKRPLKGGFLAGVKPSYALKGKAVRYDVIVPAP